MPILSGKIKISIVFAIMIITFPLVLFSQEVAGNSNGIAAACHPFEPKMSLGSFMGTGALMDINTAMDDRFSDYLGLAKDQLKEITLLKSTYVKETDPLRKQLLGKRLKLFDLWSAPRIDLNSLNILNRDILSLLLSFSYMESDYQSKVLEILTPVQREKMGYKSIMDYQSIGK